MPTSEILSGTFAGSATVSRSGWPVAELLEALTPELPDFLDADGLRRCKAAARLIPGSAASHYLECRPGQSARIDLLSCLAAKGAASDYAPLLLGSTDLSPEGELNRALLRAWMDSSHVLSQAPCVWFEYDHANGDSAGRWAASPSVGLEPGYQRRHYKAKYGVAPEAPALVDATLELLLPRSQVEHTRMAVQRCLQSLASLDGSVGYLSVMTARRPAVSKLYAVLPRRLTRDFLGLIRWPGRVSQALELMERLYAPELETTYLDLTIGEDVEQRLGIALSQFHGREKRARGEARLHLPGELEWARRALATWPGITRTTIADRRCSIRRWLDLKAVLHDDGTEYKAYLGFAGTLPSLFE